MGALFSTTKPHQACSRVMPRESWDGPDISNCYALHRALAATHPSTSPNTAFQGPQHPPAILPTPPTPSPLLNKARHQMLQLSSGLEVYYGKQEPHTYSPFGLHQRVQSKSIPSATPAGPPSPRPGLRMACISRADNHSTIHAKRHIGWMDGCLGSIFSMLRTRQPLSAATRYLSPLATTGGNP